MGAIVAVAFSFLASACIVGPADVGSEGVDASLCIEDQDAEGAAILSCPAVAFESTREPVDAESGPSLRPGAFEPAFDRFDGVPRLPVVPEASEPTLDGVDFDGGRGPRTYASCPPVYCDDVRCWCRVFHGDTWCSYGECPPN